MDHDHSMHTMPEETGREYLKLAVLLLGILLLAGTLTHFQGWSLESLLPNVMGVFFVVFALFKLLDLKMFAITYAGYDVVAKRWLVWGYIYPFVELALGVGYLSLGDHNLLNGVALVVVAVASLGVVQELLKKSKIKCACLGKFIKLPLTKVSLTEDLAMLAMAAYMIVA